MEPNTSTGMFWTALVLVCFEQPFIFQSIKSIVSGSLILFNCHLAWAQVRQQHHLPRSLASYYLLFFSYLSSINGNDRLCSFLLRYINMYPLGDQYSTNSLSLYLHLHDLNKIPLETGMVIELTLSILDQKHEGHYTVTGSTLHNIYQHYYWLVATFVWIRPYFAANAGRFMFGVAAKIGWGWSNFIPLKTLMDPFSCYIVGSNCMLKADVTIIGSSNDG